VAQAGISATEQTADAAEFSTRLYDSYEELRSPYDSPTKELISAYLGINVKPVWHTLTSTFADSAQELMGRARDTDYIRPTDSWAQATWQERFKPENLGETLFHTGADVTGSLALYAANPAVGFAVAAGSTAEGIYEQAKLNRLDENTSLSLGLATGLAVGAIDRIVPDEIMSPSVRKEFVRGFARRMGGFIANATKSGLKEAATEALQENLQIIVENTFRDLGWDEVTQRNVMAAFGGILGGSGMSSIYQGIEAAATGEKQGGASIEPPTAAANTERRNSVASTTANSLISTFKGQETVSRGEISSLLTNPKTKQVDKAALEAVLRGMEDDTVTNEELSNLIKSEFLLLDSKSKGTGDRVYETSSTLDSSQKQAGAPNYFAQTRVRDLEDNSRVVTAIQSKIFDNAEAPTSLAPYKNNWYHRVVREEVTRAARDKKINISFPTANKAVAAFVSREYPSAVPYTDPRGNSWVKVPVTKSMAKDSPVAFMRNTGKTRQVSRDQAKETIKNYTSRLKISNAEVQLADYILTNNGAAFAATFGNNITFVEGLPQFAAEHEMIHLVVKNIEKFDIFKDDGITRSMLMNEMRLRYPSLENTYELEERLAEEYEIYVERKINGEDTSFMGRLEKFFAKFLDLFKKMFNAENRDATRKFFDFVYEGTNSAPVVLSEADQSGFASIHNGKITVDFSKVSDAHFKKEEIDPEELVELKTRASEMLADFKASEAGDAIKEELEVNKRSAVDLNENVVKGIKNSAFFRVEKDISDDMGEGYLMKNNKGKFIIVPSNMRETYIIREWFVVNEIDSLATESGYDSGYDYLLDQLDLSQLPTDLTSVADQKLRQTSKEYNNIKEKLANMKDALRGRVVTRELHLSKIGEFQRTKYRRTKVSAALSYFNLTKAQMKGLTRRDVGKMTSYEFEQYMYDLEVRAVEAQETSEKKSELMQLIRDKEFRNFSALRRAMELPTIKNMSIDQMSRFIDALSGYQQGDHFLSKRKLETVHRTVLRGAKTIREAREHLKESASVRLGREVTDADLAMSSKVSAADTVKGDVTLGETNVLMSVITREFHEGMIAADLRLKVVEDEFNSKVKIARASRKKSLWDRVAPQDVHVISWLEANDAKKAELEKQMTPEELDLAQYMRTQYKKAYDYLIKMHYLHNGIENYYNHVRREFFEVTRDEGVWAGVKSAFKANDIDIEQFNIISDTGEILPLEKFAPFLQHRSGKLAPTKNVARSFNQYFSTFSRKMALDSVVPLIDIYTYAVEPKETTDRDLQKDRSLRKFINEWTNNKRGRKTTFGGKLVQGGKLDMGLRSLKTFVSLMYIGFSPITAIAASGGEQSLLTTAIGLKKRTLGDARRVTKQGRKIIKKYDSFLGKGFFETMGLPENTPGDYFWQSAFGFLGVASRTAEITWLLGEMTQEEFDSGEISVKRLADIKFDMGRYKAVSDFKSIVGSTSIGAIGTQFRSWAIPVANTIILRNGRFLLKSLKNKKLPVNSREFQELLRGTLIVAGIWLLFGNMEEDDSFLGNLKRRLYRDSMSLVGALSLRTLLGMPPSADFLWQLIDNVEDLITMQRYASTGELQGLSRLKRQLTPSIIKQLTPDEESGSSGSANPFDSVTSSRSSGDNPFDSVTSSRSSGDNPFDSVTSSR
jgi:hypothetical protein